jgi:hypothetical protein
MSVYYNNRVQPLKALYDKIEELCLKHIAISSYDCGDLDSFDGEIMTFPAAYLETINEMQDNGYTETYSIALNLLDRMPQDATRAQMIATHDSLKQIFSELQAYMQLKKKSFGTIGNPSILLFNDFVDTRLVRLRADFTITVEPLETTPADLASIFPDASTPIIIIGPPHNEGAGGE